MHHLQVGPFHCQCVINAALNAVIYFFYDNLVQCVRGMLQEMFGAVMLYWAENVNVCMYV